MISVYTKAIISTGIQKLQIYLYDGERARQPGSAASPLLPAKRARGLALSHIAREFQLDQCSVIDTNVTPSQLLSATL